MFSRVLIANRGEIALRVIRACKEMGIETVAIYSEADRGAQYLELADQAICVGTAKSMDSYLRIDRVIAAAEVSNADAIHPGYGFLSENADFSQLCRDHKIKFIGPSPEVINTMGDKATAKKTMIAAGVPVVPGSDGVIDTLDEAYEWAEKIGYPVLLKATAGGGGKGMRLCWERSELAKGWETAKAEAGAAFGNDGVYMEKYITEPRHIEIQVVGDGQGNVSHLSERDCTIQRRHQKLVEESPSPVMTEERRKRMGDDAVRAAKYVNYEGAGTIEFIYDSKTNEYYFMEMNTRIQVEHPVTEEIFDFDLIKEQILVALGEKVSGNNYFPNNRHAIEVRINAEDPFNGFRPNAGRITGFHKPGGHKVRVDTHAYANYVVPPYYDSMIAKLIVSSFTREEALAKLERALEEFFIEGIHTTIPFHQQLVKDPVFRSGIYATNFLDSFKLEPPTEKNNKRY